MKLGKALRLVLSRWDITPYRLAKASSVGQATIGKLIKGELESSTWDVVERLANGFERLDIVARVTFLGLLTLPEDRLPAYGVAPLPHLEEIEKPENITKVLAVADKLRKRNPEAVQGLEQDAYFFAQQISLELQRARLEEPDQNA
jgi:hypothetical protein